MIVTVMPRPWLNRFSFCFVPIELEVYMGFLVGKSLLKFGSSKMNLFSDSPLEVNQN